MPKPRIVCQRHGCDVRATLFVAAYSHPEGQPWQGYFCWKDGPRIIRLRMRLIRKYGQNVVLRPMTNYDRKRIRKGKQVKL